MNLAIAAAVFPVIFLGELPDKTMVASLVLATRGRAWSVWSGGAAAFVIHVAIATTAGVALARVLPQRGTDALAAAMFLAGAVISGREAWRARTREAIRDGGRAPAPGRGRATVTAFTLVFAAEWGDLTQILTASLAARYHAPLSVATGALLALWAAGAIAVTGGQRLGRLIHPAVIRLAAAVVLAALAGWSCWAALA